MATLSGVDQFRAGLAVIERAIRARVERKRAGTAVAIMWAVSGRRFAAADAPLVDAISLEAVCTGHTATVVFSRQQVIDSADGGVRAGSAVRAALAELGGA
jgi:hypothetical protein